MGYGFLFFNSIYITRHSTIPRKKTGYDSGYICLLHPPCMLQGSQISYHIFNATFNNILAISWWSGLLVEETGGPGENHQPVASH
jgi:hypothetical protein